MKKRMRKRILTLWNILFIGAITTVVRIIGQLSIPAGNQSILGPSIFAQNGTMPLAFTIYGVFAYSIIAALFLFIRNQMQGNRLLQGFQYALFCCVTWVAYLWEPLPHVAPLDRITYPIADSLALLVMGLLLGLLLGNRDNAQKRQRPGNLPKPLSLFLSLCPIRYMLE